MSTDTIPHPTPENVPSKKRIPSAIIIRMLPALIKLTFKSAFSFISLIPTVQLKNPVITRTKLTTADKLFSIIFLPTNFPTNNVKIKLNMSEEIIAYDIDIRCFVFG